MTKPHHRLEVWKKAIDFVKHIYAATSDFPVEEKFGLISQMRRAAVSIPSNISEGAARQSRKEFINFLSIAQGSVAELETQLIIAKELNFFSIEVADDLLEALEDISKMIIGLQRSLKFSK
ncbi:MAG: four helix bundle protein [Deltaproteobacteria bacterium]|nr:four helix bundle protein [Deltaproteobacteria bacterium]